MHPLSHPCSALRDNLTKKRYYYRIRVLLNTDKLPLWDHHRDETASWGLHLKSVWTFITEQLLTRELSERDTNSDFTESNFLDEVTKGHNISKQSRLVETADTLNAI